MNASQTEIYTDFHGLSELKARAGRDQSAALQETARQFEAIFMKMMLKSMRDAVPESGLLDDDKSRFYRGMYDDQMALSLSRNPGLGLADMIVRQLGGTEETESSPHGKTLADYRVTALKSVIPSQAPAPVEQAAAPTRGQPLDPDLPINSPQDFIETLWPHAQQAAKTLGVEPQVLLAQSALETGWGKHMIRRPDGQNSFNLFGIKAHRDWAGESVTVSTLEYHEQQALRRHEPFRAYSGYAESFQDYVQFLQSNPRYQEALNSTDSADDFVQGLQDAGYATDPRYAEKIRNILNREDFTVWVDQFKAGEQAPITA